MSDDPGRGTKQRLTVAQAADALGLTVDAVRSRISRNTIEHVRESGRVYVLLNSDEYRQGRDQYTDKGSDQDRNADLIATLRDDIGHLRREAERKDAIILSLTQANAEQARTIRAIEAPTDSPTGWRGSPGPGEAGDDKGNVTVQQQQHVDEATDAEEAADRSSAGRQAQRRQPTALNWLGLLLVPVIITLAGFSFTVSSASGESSAGISASVWDAFSTAFSSGLSSVTGDQVAIIVGSIITLIGTIASTYLGIRWSRRGRNQ